jgi:hypothetical protein
MEVSSFFATLLSRSQHTTMVCWGGGLNKYQRLAADCLQRALRARFRQQLKAGVRLLGRKVLFRQQFPETCQSQNLSGIPACLFVNLRAKMWLS